MGSDVEQFGGISLVLTIIAFKIAILLVGGVLAGTARIVYVVVYHNFPIILTFLRC